MVVTGADKSRSYSGDYMAAGRASEELVLSWLVAKTNVVKLRDVSDHPEYQDKDVDLLVWLEGAPRELRCEVKRDEHLGQSGNVLFEFARIYHTTDPGLSVQLGWSVYSWADIFIYHAAATQQLWLCRADDLRRAFQRYSEEARRRIRFNPVATDRIKTTINVLIPEKYCKSVFTIYDVSSSWRTALRLRAA